MYIIGIIIKLLVTHIDGAILNFYKSIFPCYCFCFSILEKFEPPEILSVKKITGVKQLLTVTWKMPEKIIPSQDLICQVQYRNLYSNSSVSYINFLMNVSFFVTNFFML